MHFCFRSEIFLQDKEYDSWGAVADYVFQVFLVSVSPAGHSILLVEEFQRNICIDAPPRSSGDSRGRWYERCELQTLIVRQDGVHDISFLLAKNKPHIVVDESGGQLPPQSDKLGLIFPVGRIIGRQESSQQGKNCAVSGTQVGIVQFRPTQEWLMRPRRL